MKIRPIHLAWLLLFCSTIAIGVVAFWLLNREAERIEDLARDTLVSRAAAASDNLAVLVSEIQNGVTESLIALENAGDQQAALARLVASNPFAVAGFAQRESDGVTFWYGDRGDLPDPSQVLDLALLSEEEKQVLAAISPRNRDSPSSDLERSGAAREELAPTDGFVSSFSPQLKSRVKVGSSVAEEVETEDEGFSGDGTSETNRIALQEQLAVVRGLNMANRKQILEPEADALIPIEEEPSVSLASQSQLEESKLSSDEAALNEVELSLQIDSFTYGDYSVPEPPLAGWIVIPENNPLEQLGWVRFATNDFLLGVWLDPVALESELKKTLFLNETDGLRLRLQSPSGGEIVGSVEKTVSSLGERNYEEVTLSVGSSLAGWSLEALQVGTNPFGSGFRVLGAVIVVGLGLAILLSGSLLLRQSRIDALEAQRKTTFVANVSHELKTPLTGIRMFAEMLSEEKVEDPAKKARYLERISSETQRLSRLVNNVLDFSRLDRNDRKFRVEPTNLETAITEIVESHRSRLLQEGLKVELSFEDRIPKVNADGDALEQVLVNLLDNAAKYAASGEKVRIEVRQVRDRVQLEVVDFGPGIPSKEKARVFNAFHRVDDRLTAEQSGCGLGLSIAARLARGMSAQLELMENQPSGCRFRLSFPTMAEEKR
ncbi:MAG: HAMP domain-containing sensor histidine kinase [Verrucomicrobiota bacterium]